MIRQLILWLALACTAGAQETAPAPAAPSASAAPPVRSLLLASRQAAAPGDPLLLGLLLEPAAGWHLYWRGLNDSGLPPEPSLALPEGARWLEDWQWPAPERLVSPGDILDHVYPRRLLLTAALLLPSAAPAEDGYTLRGKVDWVACREACRFGSDSLSLHLPLRAAGQPPLASAAAARIEAVREALPIPLANGQAGLTIARGERSVLVALDGAEELAFYPALDCIVLSNPLADGEAIGDRLNLRLKGGAMAAGRLRGILAALADGERRHYLLDHPLGATASAESPPTKE